MAQLKIQWVWEPGETPPDRDCHACGEPIAWSYFVIGPPNADRGLIFHDSRCVGAFINVAAAHPDSRPADDADIARAMELVISMERT